MSDEDAVVEKRGPGRPPKGERVHKVTYLPRDPGDPHEIIAYEGRKFVANIPRDVRADECIKVPLRQESTNADGNAVFKYPERLVPVVDLARKNLCFSVDGEPPPKAGEGKIRLPEDPDHYRGWALSWISRENSLESLNARWAAEQLLRERCGLDDGDTAYLNERIEVQRMLLSAQ